MQLNLFREIVVDNFAGGGGASTGIEMATGLSVDIAINHDPAAIAMHKVNHPDTEHYCESVWEVDPRKAVKGRKVALCWFSPDCKHFSKAKGGKPVEKNIRGLAWVAVRWAATVRPRVIILENVEEFKTWGPLLKDGKPDPSKKGKTFQSFINALNKLGYQVDYKELRACDYGAPTIRKRLFLIARCDGKEITWPSPTHGNPQSDLVKNGLLKPWKTAAGIIDWSIPCPSIFDRKKPLSENTLRRIARGVKKFVIDTPQPFIARIGQTKFGGDRLQYSLNKPLTTITTKAEHLLIAPTLIQMGYGDSEGRRVLDLNKPLGTITAGGNKFAIATAFVAQHFGNSTGHAINQPLSTVTAVNKASLVTAFLTKYYGTDTGQDLESPLHTVTTKDRFGLVTVHGKDYQIVDIGMRMLEPSELFLAQGFPEDYIINQDNEGNKYSKAKQVARCGNAVPPPFAEHLVRANLPEICIENEKNIFKLAASI
ncbi:DNA cytosine methyltransferase [Bacillus thuringiensis]|uniref:DNA (cytosine-5-)-methyltransferase n=1 Tax=Bacillus thuringiensis subsp. jegathesan TaxID=56955 RepID=A0A9X6LWF7_BACTJ|nr:DNA cytosine methyltransferase [Bacillus thuringiensis]OUB59021.1 DNA cytosine methyltransferase [Bacillus thuringiensis serovar jegathesan]